MWILPVVKRIFSVNSTTLWPFQDLYSYVSSRWSKAFQSSRVTSITPKWHLEMAHLVSLVFGTSIRLPPLLLGQWKNEEERGWWGQCPQWSFSSSTLCTFQHFLLCRKWLWRSFTGVLSPDWTVAWRGHWKHLKVHTSPKGHWPFPRGHPSPVTLSHSPFRTFAHPHCAPFAGEQGQAMHLTSTLSDWPRRTVRLFI